VETHLRERVQIFSDPESLSHGVTSGFIDMARKFIEEKGRFMVAISGGLTPNRMFSLLGSEYRDQVNWQCVHVFWVDERCVPVEDELSNYRHARDRWLAHVPLPDRNIHRIRGEQNAEEEALRYEDEIKKIFGVQGFPEFDLILLGLGEDGHTASLFPDSDSLEEKDRIAIPVLVKKNGSWRITLTLGVLNHARNIFFLVSGETKSTVFSEVLMSKEQRKVYPVGLVRPIHGDIIWMVDSAAASGLKQ
jgi:6-phosphogluconolactonase